MMTLRGFLAVALVAFGPACSDDSANRPNVVCNELVNDGPDVTYEVVTGTVPTPTGGTVTDGTYELTALHLYDWTMPTPTAVLSGTIVFEGNTMQQALSRDFVETRYTSTYTISGTMFTMTDTCPAAAVDQASFSATANDFTFYKDNDGATIEVVFSKR
jgi:hypothetical protein